MLLWREKLSSWEWMMGMWFVFVAAAGEEAWKPAAKAPGAGCESTGRRVKAGRARSLAGRARGPRRPGIAIEKGTRQKVGHWSNKRYNASIQFKLWVPVQYGSNFQILVVSIANSIIQDVITA